MIRILVVDDHKILRQGIVGLLKSAGDFEVAGEAGTGEAAVRLARDLNPDVIVMDLSLPGIDGLEAARQIFAQGVTSEIVFLTMHNDPGMCQAAAKIGVRGYLLKDDAMDDLFYAIKAVLRGEHFTSGSVTPSLLLPDFSGPALTGREKEIAAMIVEGLNSRQIATSLQISLRTVEAHRSHILEKLGCRNVVDLIKYVLGSGPAQ